FMKRFSDVQFITATQAAKMYRDKSLGRKYTPADLRKIAAAVTDQVSFQKWEDYSLSAGDVFVLLNDYFVEKSSGNNPPAILLKLSPLGPSQPVLTLPAPLITDASQFTRTAADVADFYRRHGRVPDSVWLGSVGVPPESYLRALAQVTIGLIDAK